MSAIEFGDIPPDLLDMLDMGVALLDADSRVLSWNDWLAAASSIPSDSAVGTPIEDLLPHGRANPLSVAVAACLEFGASRLLSHALHPGLLPLKTRAGQDMSHDVTVRAWGLRNERRCLIQIADVSVAAKREHVLRQRQNARYDAVVESAPDAIITLDEDDKILFVNSAAVRQFGYAARELVGADAAFLFEIPSAWNELRSALLAGEAVRLPAELVARRKDGSRSHLEVSLSRWINLSQGLMTAILRNVSDRRAAQEKLVASEQQFRALAQAMPNHVWTALPDGGIEWLNDRVYEYCGLARGSRVASGWSEFVHLDDRAAAGEAWSKALATGAPYEAQFRIRDAGGRYRWHLVRAFAIRAADGEIVRWVGSNTDIEDQKVAAQALVDVNVALEQRVSERTAQLMEAEEALRQSQKMEALGQLTGGIAHDFNNLLQGIIGALDVVRRRIAKGRTGDLEPFLVGALESANRAATLTHRLLAFARRQPVDPRSVDVNALVRSVEELLRRSLGENVTLELLLGEDLWRVRCDANQLENALLNLAINARDAMPDGGVLTVSTANATLHAYEARQRDLSPGDYVRLSVADTGLGMSPAVKARAFDPFYTTKPVGKGTGLGLSMIYGFMRQSDGSATLASEPGEGTSVEMCLPRHDGPIADLPKDNSPGDNRSGESEVVLVVEDQAVVRTLMVETLRDLGYDALETGDGAEALRILQSGSRVDLLVTDIGLPGLNGRQLADAARETRPDLKVLFCTGYAENAAGSGFLASGMGIISKPFQMELLARKVREMIRQA